MTDHNKKPDDSQEPDSQQYKRQQRYSFWDGVMNRFSNLSISVVEIILKTMLTFAILLSTIVGVCISTFTDVIYYLPLSFVLAATLSIIFIWRSKNRSLATENLESLKTMKKRLDTLYKVTQEQEKRLKNIEIVESFEDRLARQQLDRDNPAFDDSLVSKVPLRDQRGNPKQASSAMGKVYE